MSPAHVDVAGSGFTVLDRIYEDNRRTHEEIGGSCGNVLWSLARLHHTVVPVLTLGEDQVGQTLRQNFSEAGADVSYIEMRTGIRTPLLAQFVDGVGHHHFSSVCPETHHRYPRYHAIGVEESEAASAMLSRCRVFYADRLSAGIVSAMETVASRGGIVFFEPSAVGDRDLFARALASVSIIKCSQDRIQDLEGMLGRQRVYRVVTEGADGLRTGRQGGLTHMPAYVAGSVRDTSGSGDVVSVGLIDHLLKVGARADTISTSDLMSGLRAGQRLAAANCAFIGARGIFRHASPDDARCALNG